MLKTILIVEGLVIRFYERLKVGLSLSKKVGFICFNGRPFKIMKNAFYFLLKAPLNISIFLPNFSGHVGKRLDKRAKVNL